MHTRKLLIRFLLLVSAMAFTGCFGDKDKNSDPVAPTTYVTLNGTLTAPDKIESSLLGNTLQNTDSQVRTAYKAAKIYVNGYPVSTFELSDMASNADWPLKIENAPESSTGLYTIDVVVGNITLKSKVRDSEKSEFRINLETTAAAMLAETVGREQHELLITYLAFVNTLKNELAASVQKTSAALAVGSIVNDAAVVAVLASQTERLKSIADMTTAARFAYLELENDLDGDGKNDLFVKLNASGERVSFYTTLSSENSMREDVSSIDSYTDAELLADFADPAKLSQVRTFGPGAPKTILGLYFKKSASGDKYLKLYIHRIDLADGDFAGVLVEYAHVATTTTAISRGQKILMRQDSALIENAVYATNFITDSDDTVGKLSFLGAAKGVGSDGARMVLALDGVTDIDKLAKAPEWLTNGGNYYFNTADSLKNELYAAKVLEIGDVFAAYFPAAKHYALFKINWIGEDRVVVDYIVNASEDERLFK